MAQVPERNGSRSIGDRPAIELSWPNKDQLLVADGDSYKWVPRDSRVVIERAGIEVTGVVGAPGQVRQSNMLLHGDALDGLTGLASQTEFGCRAEVRLVYIDPPFNTGQGYGDYVDDLQPAMWLSMLRDRLEALRPLLAADASIWVHLDDAHAHHARAILEEVFGPQAFVTTVVWQKRTTRDSRKAFASQHDYIHVFSPAGPRAWKVTRNTLPKEASAFKNPDADPRGPWTDAPFTAPGYRAGQQYEIVTPAGNRITPPGGRSWFATEPVYERLRRENRIYFPRNGAGSPRLKIFRDDAKGLVPSTLWTTDVGTNDEATRHLMQLFPDVEPFATPKPEQLLAQVIRIASNPGDLVLDCFAGSGTTAAAAHKLGRRWIAIERSAAIIQEYTLPRLHQVVTGHDSGGVTAAAEWMGGGGFRTARVSGVEENILDMTTLTDADDRPLTLALFPDRPA